MRILAVDKEAEIKELSEWLTGAHTLIGVESTAAALEEIKREAPGLVIAGALDLLRATKTLSPETPFMFTASDLAAAREALTLGADDYLLKPYFAHEVLLRVSQASARSGPIAKKGLDEILLEYERTLVLGAMKEARFRQVKAAELLKITRGALQYKLKKHGYYESDADGESGANQSGDDPGPEDGTSSKKKRAA
jgi:DNA-binding NtrC family response regulator